MHKYRAAARIAACYEESDPPPYNPFRKIHRRKEESNCGADDISGATASYEDHGLWRTASESILHSSAPVDWPRNELRLQRNPTTSAVHSQSFEARSSDEGVLVSETAVYSDALIQPLSDCEVDIEGQDTCRLKKCAFLGDLKGGTKEKEARKRGKRDPSSASWLKKDKQAFTHMGQLKATLLSSWLIWFLEPAIPAGFAVKYTNQSPVTTFAVNFVAIIPLSKILDVVTEELGIYKGGHVGMMIIITFGNGVQFVITIIALLKHQSKIVQTSLIGAVISNMVLLVGIGFFLGGLQHTEQHFDRTSTSKSLDELVLSIAALIIPTAINVFSRLDADHVAQFSRAESKLLLFSYLCYLVFAYKSHSTMYTTSHTRVPERKFLATAINVETRLPRGAANLVASVGGAIVEVSSIREPEEETISPHISVSTLALTLIVDTTFLGFGVAFAVESIDGLTQQTSLTRNFVGLILLPLLGCNIHAIKLAMKDEMPHSFSITIGSSIQFLLCILPLAVIIGWVRDDPTMTLLFDEFQVVSLVIGLMVLRYITDDGKSNWFEGLVLMALYAIVALNAWFVSDKNLRPG